MNPQEFIRVYKKSEVIFEENSFGNDMYVIHSGKVKLTTKAPGSDLVLGILGPGNFFGEMALVDDAPRSATATAEEDNTKLVVLDRSKFLYLVSQQPPFALTIMHGLCQRIRDRWDLYSKLSTSKSAQ
ncbi:MAG: cyclic nucleotide-binding domain-containing protein [Deltaproteobacteria bacterium]|nr:cyclic nucleotide-binding domain-containing protein [Deltaproteobacteria bacterium]